MADVIIEPARSEEIREACLLLSHAFIRNPETAVIFRGRRDRLEALFLIQLMRQSSSVFLAKESGQIAGVMRMVEWPHCQMSLMQTVQLFPAMLGALKGTLPRAAKFNAIWHAHDPKQPHWHLGPLGISPNRQGQGIGSCLLKYFCEHLDRLRAPAYLETGKPENVRLYERFGFTVTATAQFRGVPMWFMWRPAAGVQTTAREGAKG